MFSASAAQVGSSTLYVDDVFSTYLYTGNGSTQTITNGIDLAGKGGLVWTKDRAGTRFHCLVDSASGLDKLLSTNSTSAQTAGGGTVTGFTSSGYTISSQAVVNLNTESMVSWTFRKAPKFFDVVTFSYGGSGPVTFNHSLGQAPGMVVIKNTATTDNWWVYHRSIPTQYIVLNQTAAAQSSNIFTATATDFTIAHGVLLSGTHVAYLFAHDTATDGIIQCGSFTSAAGVESVTLGWEPQYLLYKRSNSTGGDWFIADNMRGVPTGSASSLLSANTSAAEAVGLNITFKATGFEMDIGSTGDTWVYIAIRRPNKPPTTGTQVFSVAGRGPGTNKYEYFAGFPVDFALNRIKSSATEMRASSRITGAGYLQTPLSAVETGTGYLWDDMTTFSAGETNSTDSNRIAWMFRRAPGFFDEVCFTGTGTTNNPAHNLGVVPELIISKNRTTDTGGNWGVAVLTSSPPYKLSLNLTSAGTDATGWFTATSSTFNTANICTNNSGVQFVAYLFATSPGISKVFSYTGNGSSQTINCGFTGGARFVLIKRTDSTGDWLCWDATRGIVAANDPHLSLNTTAAEVTTDDSVDTDSTGFIVNQVAATNVNVNAATYIGLAIA